MASKIEKLLGLAADMERFSPSDDALTRMVQDCTRPDADELSLDELEFLSAAGNAYHPDAPDKREKKFSLPLDK